jgi:cytochrome c oxidase subunit 2
MWVPEVLVKERHRLEEIKQDIINGFNNAWGPAAVGLIKYVTIAILFTFIIDHLGRLFKIRPYLLAKLRIGKFFRSDYEEVTDNIWGFIFLAGFEMFDFFAEEDYQQDLLVKEYFKKYYATSKLSQTALIKCYEACLDWFSSVFVEYPEQELLFDQLILNYNYATYRKSHATWYTLWLGAMQCPNLIYKPGYRRYDYIHRYIFDVEKNEDLSTIEADFLDLDLMWFVKEYIIQNKIRYYTYFSRLINRVYYIIAPRLTRGYYRAHLFKGFDYETTEEDLFQKPGPYKVFSEWADEDFAGFRYFYRKLDIKTLQAPYWHRYDNIEVLHKKLNLIQDRLIVEDNKFEIDPENEGINMLEYEIFFDSPVSRQIGFQDPATPIMEGIIDLHHDLFFFMVVISIFVVWVLSRIIYFFAIRNDEIHVPIRFTHHTTLEVVWTIIPSLILILIAVPSFALLYAMDEVINPSITIKTVGHQWYWSYEYSDQGVLAKDQILFDSYMMSEEDLTLGYLRLLEVDNRVVLPSKVHVRILITAADVLHSWAVPSLGIKLDACPGRLNQVAVYIKRNGTFYGQCSEICGVNHAFMPITVDAVSMDDYINWVSSKLEENN